LCHIGLEFYKIVIVTLSINCQDVMKTDEKGEQTIPTNDNREFNYHNLIMLDS
jgi:hypothetical protein